MTSRNIQSGLNNFFFFTINLARILQDAGLACFKSYDEFDDKDDASMHWIFFAVLQYIPLIGVLRMRMHNRAQKKKQKEVFRYIKPRNLRTRSLFWFFVT
jgi:hypothetical protein